MCPNLRAASRVDDLRHAGWHIVAQRSKKRLNKWWYMATFNSTVAGNFGDGVGWSEWAVSELIAKEDLARGEWE